jgi:hypothetical protein
MVRADVLLAISKSSIDLTERQCVKLIMAAAGKNGEESTKKAPKSAKKTKKNIAAGDDDVTGDSDSVAFFRQVVETVMSRPGGSDASVLGETLRTLPVFAVSILLKVLAMMLRGLCAEGGCGSSASDVSDTAVQNALTWIEAILEAHFHSVAMGSDVDGMHSAMRTLLAVVKDISPAIDLTESALGLCTHIHRMNRHNYHNRGSQSTGVDGVSWSSEGSNGVYQLSVVRF